MLNPINLTEPQNRWMQEIWTELYQDDRVRSLEGPLMLSILDKVKTWPAPLVLTEQEDRRIQYQLEQFVEVMKPYPYPYYPTTFGQDTQQLDLVSGILKIMEDAR